MRITFAFFAIFLLKNSKKRVFPFNTRPLVAFLRAKQHASLG
jgi:hypothetical protein